MKHNKKRNTAFIYETLAKELTKNIVDKDDGRKNKVVRILKEFFVQGTILARELELYQILLQTQNVQKEIAERLLGETKKARVILDQNKIFDAQSRLIAAVNKGIGQQVWANFVPNFKSLASVSAIFNIKTAVKQRVLFEQSIIDKMSAKKSSQFPDNLRSIDNLVYGSFIKKFNNKYGDLIQEQKDLLNHYIISFADDGFELRLYLNEEIGRLKTLLSELGADTQASLIVEKTQAVQGYLENIRKREFAEADIDKILKTQQLVRELQE